MASERTEGLIIKQKVEDMILYAYPALSQFPKGEKYALVTDMKKIMHEMLGYCIEIEKKRTKKTSIEKLDIETAKLKYFVRLSHELHFLATRKYEYWEGLIKEIGKMIGGLLKAEQQADNHRG